MEEKWIKIPDYEDLYEINNSGKIKDLIKNTIVEQFISGDGIVKVKLFKDSLIKEFSINDLIYNTFVKQKENSNIIFEVKIINRREHDNNNEIYQANDNTKTKECFVEKGVLENKIIISKTPDFYWDTINKKIVDKDSQENNNVELKTVQSCCELTKEVVDKINNSINVVINPSGDLFRFVVVD